MFELFRTSITSFKLPEIYTSPDAELKIDLVCDTVSYTFCLSPVDTPKIRELQRIVNHHSELIATLQSRLDDLIKSSDKLVLRNQTASQKDDSSTESDDYDTPKQRSPYQKFLSQELKRQRELHPGKRNIDYMKLAGHAWHSLSDEEKDKFRKAANNNSY